MLVKMHGPGVASKMRMHMFRNFRTFRSGAVGVFLHHKSYRIVADRLTDTLSLRVKQELRGCRRFSLVENRRVLHEVPGGIFHQRNGANFVSLAVQNDLWRGIQFQVADANIQHFLDASTRIVKRLNKRKRKWYNTAMS